MKQLFAVCCLLVAHSAAAQKILIPYRAGNQFGLCDEKGRVVVKPQFDRVHWMQGSWFSTGSELLLNDTLIEAGNRKLIRTGIRGGASGLLHDGVIVLKDEPFDKYEIISDRCILARYEGRGSSLTQAQFDKYGDRRRLVSLFNQRGENLDTGNFQRLQLLDTTGSSSYDPKACRYLLFLAQRFDDRYCMLVYDADEQKISDWLLKDVRTITADRAGNSPGRFAFVVQDAEGRSASKILDHTGGRFLLQDGGPALSGKPAPPKPREQPVVREQVPDAGDVSAPDGIPPPDAGERRSMAPPSFQAYYSRIRDSLYWVTGPDKRQPVKLAAGSTIILIEPRGMTQYQPVIVRNGSRFYLLQSGQVGAAVYDSLIYFGRYFLAWKTVSGVRKAGVVNGADSVVIPFDYDSLAAGVRLLTVVSTFVNGKSGMRLALKEADSKYQYGEVNPYKREPDYLLTVCKDGRCGVLGMTGKVVIPLEYELIARNNVSNTGPAIKSDFLVLKKNGRYGMARLLYSQQTRQEELSVFVAPRLEYVPTHYYPDYYGVKGFVLVGLSDEGADFKGYASGEGQAFYKD